MPLLRIGVALAVAASLTAPAVAARGGSPAAFADPPSRVGLTMAPDFVLAIRGDGRCIPALGVARRSNTPGILPPRAWIAGRLARLGATRHFHHGLLTGRC